MHRIYWVSAILLSSALIVSCADSDSRKPHWEPADVQEGQPGGQQGGQQGGQEGGQQGGQEGGQQGGQQGGQEGGQQGGQEGGQQSGAAIGWCNVQYAKTPINKGESFEVYSQVYVEGVTGQNGSHSGLQGQFGYVVADPSKTLDDVIWSDASRNEGFDGEGSDNNDEFLSNSVVANDAGMYVVYYRYSTDNGNTWTYCDKDGIATSVDLDKITLVTVNDNGQSGEQGNSSIGWCNVQYAASPINKGEAFESYSRVYAEGITGQNGSHSGIKSQFGYVVADTSKTLSDVNWSDAVRNEGYDSDGSDANDEYMSKDVIASEAGMYVIYYRYSTDDGANWTYCDKEGIATAVDVNKVTLVTVNEGGNPGEQPGTSSIAECNVQYAKTPINKGEAFETYSRVKIEGVTGQNGSHSGVKSQFGYVVADPSKTLNDVKWTDAVRNEGFNDSDADVKDEYMSNTVIASDAGTYAIFYRYSMDDGANWTYCDKAGIATAVDTNNITLVTVKDEGGEEPPVGDAKIEWCKITWPTTDYTQANNEFSPGEPIKIFAQVYAPGITGKNGTHTGIKAQFGYVVSSTSSKYEDVKWFEAKYNPEYNGDAVDNNDEYMIAEDVTPEVGDYVAFYAFSADNGETWVGCDGAGILESPDKLVIDNLVFFGVK